MEGNDWDLARGNDDAKQGKNKKKNTKETTWVETVALMWKVKKREAIKVNSRLLGG